MAWKSFQEVQTLKDHISCQSIAYQLTLKSCKKKKKPRCEILSPRISNIHNCLISQPIERTRNNFVLHQKFPKTLSIKSPLALTEFIKKNTTFIFFLCTQKSPNSCNITMSIYRYNTCQTFVSMNDSECYTTKISTSMINKDINSGCYKNKNFHNYNYSGEE